jgi:segregation and condensation protein A
VENYKIVTETFSGPLDLLLHLINKDEINIYDIPIASVTEQYLAYLATMQDFDIDLASEFLLMAAELLEIKSRMLLPRRTEEEQAEEAEPIETDPRRALAERLAVYRQFKLMGERFAELCDKNTLYAVRKPLLTDKPGKLPLSLTVAELVAAVAAFLQDEVEADAYIQSDDITVHDKINDILQLLQSQDNLTLAKTLTRTGSLGELIASFLAVLELLRLGLVKIAQPEKFGAIYLVGVG